MIEPAREILLVFFSLIFISLGRLIFKKSACVNRINFPPALAGAVVALLLINLLKMIFGINLNLTSGLSRYLLIVFFASGGLLINLRNLKQHGRPLIKLCACCLLLIIGQNILGIIIAKYYNWPPLLGLLSGSVAFVGGLGSAAAWGQEIALLGIDNAKASALVCASAALISGALISSPYSEWLICRNKIAPDNQQNPETNITIKAQSSKLLPGNMLPALLLLSFITIVSISLTPFLKNLGLVIPEFLTAMLLAIIAGNLKISHLKIAKMHKEANFIEEQSLDLFLVLSLISLDLLVLKNQAGSLLLICISQITLTLLIADLLVFRIMGKDYESAVITGGLLGFGLSSYAVALATVQQLKQRYGHAPRAIILIALTGGALVNLLNNLIIWLFYNILR